MNSVVTTGSNRYNTPKLKFVEFRLKLGVIPVQQDQVVDRGGVVCDGVEGFKPM